MRDKERTTARRRHDDFGRGHAAVTECDEVKVGSATLTRRIKVQKSGSRLIQVIDVDGELGPTEGQLQDELRRYAPDLILKLCDNTITIKTSTRARDNQLAARTRTFLAKLPLMTSDRGATTPHIQRMVDSDEAFQARRARREAIRQARTAGTPAPTN